MIAMVSGPGWPRWWGVTNRGLFLLTLFLSVAGAGIPAFAGAPPAPADGSPAALIAASRAAFDVRKYARADSLAEAACALLADAPVDDPLPRASALVALARARAARRSLADSVAVRSARQALELLPSGDRERDAVRADAHDVLALILDEQNRSDLALDHAHRALALRRACFGDAHEEVSESWYRLGVAQMSLGLVDSSLATMRAGLAVRTGLGLARDRRVGDFHCEIASLLDDQGDLDGARAELDAGVREYAARLGARHSAMTQGLQRQSIFEYRNGDLARAADLSQQAVALAESLPGYNPVNLALLRANLAVALTELGDVARARRALEQVVPVYTDQLGARHRQTLWAEAALAATECALGDTAAAAARYRSVCRRFETGEPLTSTGALTQARAGLARILADRDPRAALALAAAAEAAERARPDLSWSTVADAQALQMRLHADLGDRAAVARMDTALARTLDEHRLRGTAVEAQALAERSLALARTGHTAEAVAAATAGAALARTMLVRELRALPDREGLMLAGGRSAPLDALLVQALDGKADARVAWDELVRWRGLVAAEVARRRPPLDAGTDSAVAVAHEAWLAASRRLAQAEVRAAGSDDAATAARLADLRARADDAERGWAAVAPRGGAAATEASPEAVRRALGPDTVLVSFATVRTRARPERLAAFIVGARGGVTMRDLGPASRLESALAQWRALAGRPPRGSATAESSAREAGARLRALTWDVVAPLFAGAREVVFVADGPLHQLPWAALPDGRDGYLVESGPAVRVLEAERDLLRAAAPAGQPGLLAVGGVEFGAVPADTARAAARPVVAALTRALLPDCRDGRAPVFAPLPGTEREVEAIAREHGADVQLLRGVAADEAAFKRLAPGRRVIHLATHAVALDDLCEAAPDGGARGVGGLAPLDPLDSEAPPPPGAEDLPDSPWLGRRVVLALAGANLAAGADDENEGLLTADEVATLDLRGTEWVVLSACESGVAASWNREGVLGLTRAFRLAGARAVIASQWAVDDDATCEWMTALHRARAHGATGASAAMRQASREVLRARRADGRGTHPYYWAAFTATGD
jgi:hypothetical protein